MNLKKRLRHLADKLNSNPKYGKTTLLAKAAKEIDAVLLVATSDEATHLQRTHGITSKMVDLNLETLSGPFLIDNYAVVKLLQRAADKIELLENELKKYKPQPPEGVLPEAIEVQEKRTT